MNSDKSEQRSPKIQLKMQQIGLQKSFHSLSLIATLKGANNLIVLVWVY